MSNANIPSISQLQSNIEDVAENINPEVSRNWTDRFLHREGEQDLTIAYENLLLYFDREYIPGENMFAFWKEVPSLYPGFMKEMGQENPMFSHLYQSAFTGLTREIHGLYQRGVTPPFNMRVYATVFKKYGSTTPYWRGDSIRGVAYALNKLPIEIIETNELEMNLRYAVIGSFIFDETINIDSMQSMSAGLEWSLQKRQTIVDSFKKEVVLD